MCWWHRQEGFPSTASLFANAKEAGMLGWLKRKGSAVALKNAELLFTEFMTKTQSSPDAIVPEVEQGLALCCVGLSDACDAGNITLADAVYRTPENVREHFIRVSASNNHSHRKTGLMCFGLAEAFFSVLGSLPETPGRTVLLRRIASLAELAPGTGHEIESIYKERIFGESFPTMDPSVVQRLAAKAPRDGLGEITLKLTLKVILEPDAFDLDPT
jgi:hypothetical protein